MLLERFRNVVELISIRDLQNFRLPAPCLRTIQARTIEREIRYHQLHPGRGTQIQKRPT